MGSEGIFPKADGEYDYASEANTMLGNFIQIEAGESITAGNVIYIKRNDGKAYVSDTGTADDIRADGIALESKTAGQTVTVQKAGSWPTTGLTANDCYYLGASGAITTTASGVIVGYAQTTTTLVINVIQDDRDTIGTIKSYAKSFTAIPSNNLTAFWVECNGGALSDAESPLNGQTLPDLITTKRFLRGSTTSGTTGGADTFSHTHAVTGNTGAGGGNYLDGAAAGGSITTRSHNHAVSITSQDASDTQNIPAYYEVVWIMKIK